MLEVLVKLKSNPATQRIADDDQVTLVGRFGRANGTVFLHTGENFPDPEGPMVFVHVRMARNTVRYQLGDVTSLQDLARGIHAEPVLALTQLN